MEEIPKRNKRQISIDSNRVELGVGSYGNVFKGKYKGRPVAVKRVLLHNYSQNEEAAMLKLDHPNIIKLLHCESDNDFRYYAMELCVASLDMLFLPYFNKKRYIGPMPRPVEVFLQLALGLQHIHSKNLIHRSIKPNDVLICVEGDEITIKWTDFGLSRPVNERGSFSMNSGVKGTRIWLAPEMLKYWSQGGDVRGTVKSDIFALGLVFGYLFLNGEHLYGSGSYDIQKNIIEGNPINMQKIDKELRNLYENSLFLKMLEDDPVERMTLSQVVDQLMSIKEELTRKEGEMRQICSRGSKQTESVHYTNCSELDVNIFPLVGKRKKLQIHFDHSALLGKGAYGSVFKGTFEGRQVAVKRVLLEHYNVNEEEAMQQLHHQNIVQLFHCESDTQFRYYAMELCVASLDKVFLESDHPQKYKGTMPRSIDAFHQLALGLEYIHSKGFIHRDIKPKNILISEKPNGQNIEVTIKWTDFGLARKVKEWETNRLNKIKGTINWLAPEIVKLLRQGNLCRDDVKSEVFALALVFGYMLLNGEHLFGNHQNEIHCNIIEGNPINMKKIDDKLRDLYVDELLGKMLEDDPKNRISSSDVVKQLKSIKDKVLSI